MTFDDGRISTWRLPRFSALLIVFRQSASTLMRTILARVEAQRQRLKAHPGPLIAVRRPIVPVL